MRIQLVHENLSVATKVILSREKFVFMLGEERCEFLIGSLIMQGSAMDFLELCNADT